MAPIHWKDATLSESARHNQQQSKETTDEFLSKFKGIG